MCGGTRILSAGCGEGQNGALSWPTWESGVVVSKGGPPWCVLFISLCLSLDFVYQVFFISFLSIICKISVGTLDLYYITFTQRENNHMYSRCTWTLLQFISLLQTGHIIHKATNKCLDRGDKQAMDDVFVTTCANTRTQQWWFDHYLPVSSY